MTAGSDDWFVYSRTAGRITAAPANWKGWSALILLILATIALAYGAMLLTVEAHPILRFVALSAVILGGVLTIVRLAIRKGRKAS